METKFLVSFSIFLVFGLTLVAGLETGSRVHYSKLSFGEDVSWVFNDNNLDYFERHLTYVNSSTKAIYRVTAVKDFFSNNTHTYNCTYEYDRGDSTVAYPKESRLVGDEYFTAIRVYTPNLETTREWKILKFDLPTCNVVEPKFHIFATDLFVNNDFSEIFFVNSTLCGNKYCKMNVDSQLNVLSGPVPSIDIYGDNIYVNSLKSDDLDIISHHVYWKENATEKITLLTNGVPSLLWESGSPKNSFSQISTAHGVITLVYKEDAFNHETTTLKIHQFNLQGKLKFQFERIYEEKLGQIDVKSLDDGGFLLAVVRKSGPKIETEYNVTKYNANGKAVSEAVKIVFPRAGFPLGKIYLYENKDGSYCLVHPQENQSRLCSKRNCFDIVEKCFRTENLY